MLKKIKYLFLFLIIGPTLFSQKGEYFIQNYLPKDYNAGANTNAVAQDKEGRIFVAGNFGVLIYDGLNWQTLDLHDQITAFSIIADEDGTIYVGADNGEFFMIEKNEKGQFIRIALQSNLKTTDQPNEPIKQILAHNGALYFLSADKLIEKKGNSYKAFAPQNTFNIRAFPMGKNLYLTDLDYNVLVLDKGVLKYVVNTEDLISKKAFFSYKIDAKTYAVGYRGDGMYKVTYDSIDPTKTKFEKWECEINDELIESEFNNGCQLRDGNYIITTNKKGAFMINRELKMVKRFNTVSGIYEDNVKYAFQDMNKNLWLATYYGVSYIELNSKLYKYDRKHGITGLVTGASFYNNSLYLSTDKGVQYINDKESSFKVLNGFTKQTWSLSKINNELFISSDKGLFIYDGKEIVQHSEKKTFCILSDPYKPELIYAGTDEGVDVFSYIQKKLTYIKTYQLDIPVRSLASDHNKNIYFGCESNGIYYLNYYNSFLLDSIQKREGLPSVIGENYVFPHSNKLLIGTDSGVYTVKKGADDRFFCEKSESFYPLTKGTEIFRAAELEGDLVANQSYENKKLNKVDRKVIYISNENGRCYINNEITNKLKDTKVNLITYDSISKTTFLCTDEGLFLINKQKEKISRSFSFFLSSVITTKKDTVIANISSKDNSSGKKFSIAYDNNQLTFVAGYNCFENKNAVEFSYYIEGSDEETFGTWSNQNVIRTTNLHEGDYIFHIKARCDLNKEELAISFPFTILPPWYRTIWAYLVYFILFVLFLIVVVKLNSKRLIEQNLKLEGIIKQRTHTIGEQVKLLEHQKKEITDSINYAQRIQQSVLPSLTEINSVYRDFFIFFQPKDIVSGDFYWFNKMNDHEFLIACADCTGHGVPGAFMSTICSEKLTEAALKTTEPAKILFDANNAIKKVLKQDAVGDGTNKDGMEIALIKYNTQTRQLIYAGANRGMWIIRANKELEETKPTKASIASFTPFNFEYEQSVHQLDHGDMVYLTSDGYADQFGGAAGKKFMAKNMKEFLKGIVGLPVSEQKDLVSQNINDWKGSYEQVDDLLVIGVKA